MLSEQTIASSVKTQFTAGVRKAMKNKGVTQSELARRMFTSRAVVHRLLQDKNTSLTLQTMSRAASALDLVLHVKFTV